jgi:DNA-directed RNA polymerase subunit omega
MDHEYLEKSKNLVTNPRELVYLAATRAKQLARGAKAMVKSDSDNYLDVALLEIAEGKLDIDKGRKAITQE